MLVVVDKDLSLEYFVQIWLVNKIYVRDSKVLICKTIKRKEKKNTIKKASQIKGKLNYKYE